MGKTNPVQVIAVTAGKGGVGKTNVSINLALSLAKQDKRVLLLDADLGLANIDILLGLHPKHNISHVIEGTCTLEEVLVDGPLGIKIIPASSGREMMTKLTKVEHAGLINAFDQLAQDIDVLIIDTAAGISESVLSFTRSAQEIIVVVCDEPSSITDAYALIKVMNSEYGVENFRVLANMVQNTAEGKNLFQKLTKVTERFLQVKLDYVGSIPYDDYLKKSVKRQKSVCQAYPSSKSATGFTKMAEKVVQWPLQTEVTGNTCFFIERLVQSAD